MTRRTIRALLGAAVGGLLLRGVPVAAQDASDSVAYRALTQTPLGAFSPRLDAAITARRGGGPALYTRYGLQSFRSNDYVHNFAGSLDVSFASGRVGVTVGRYGPTCARNDCPGHLMASLDVSQSLTTVSLGRRENAASLNVGLEGAVGFAHPGATLFSGAALLPFALVPDRHTVRLLPFVAPGVGVGLIHSDGDTDAGMLPLLSMGVGLLAFDDRLGLTAGASRVLLRAGNWVAGVNLGWVLRP
jgi:hypothetical protein